VNFFRPALPPRTDTLAPMSPDRGSLEPNDERERAGARTRWLGMIRDAITALAVALLVVGAGEVIAALVRAVAVP
jgi:hypothetical protein